MSVLTDNLHLVIALSILTGGFVAVMHQLRKSIRSVYGDLTDARIQMDDLVQKAEDVVQSLNDSLRGCDVVALRNRVDEANRQLREEIRLRNMDHAQAEERILSTWLAERERKAQQTDERFGKAADQGD